jgi:signal transduction histidine kinase
MVVPRPREDDAADAPARSVTRPSRAAPADQTPLDPGGRASAASSLFACTAVLDEVGIGVILLDPGGEVAAQNGVGEALGRRRTDSGATLVDVLAQAGPAGGDQRLVEVTDAAGAKSIVGYRSVRSDRLGTIVTLRDITEAERVRADRLKLERLSQVGRACAMVAHEIGNPLAAIKATLQSIEHEAAAAGLAETIAPVYREIDRLDKILAGLLGFVRHRAPRRARADFGVIVARARAAAGDRLARVAFHPPPAPLPEVVCDADQIEQVMLNLFLNAADAMPSGGNLWVRAAPEGPRLAIRVEDDGAGVPKELREKVFESFFTTKPAGVGLGLPVCYRIVCDHQGSMSIEDREGGRGASVRLSLPLARSVR